MKTSIETINGKPYTVVWHKEKRGDWDSDSWLPHPNGFLLLLLRMPDGAHCIATALPALPKRPEVKDAALLHLYAAYGVFPVLEDTYGCGGAFSGYGQGDFLVSPNDYQTFTIDHNARIKEAVDAQGVRVEIAIEDVV